MRIHRCIIACIFICTSTQVRAQKADSTIQAIQQFPEKFFAKVDGKINSIDDKITKQTERYLKKLQKQEDNIRRKLGQIDSAATATFAAAKLKYTQFSKGIKEKTELVQKFTGGQYNSYLDSLTTSLSFLKQFKDVAGKVQEPLKDLQGLQNKLQQTENIRKYIAERKAQIKQLLSKYTKIPASLQKEYAKLSKTAYYYSAQLKEYKEMLKDPKKIEAKALSLLNKLPAFQKFMKENSQLASLFQIPGSAGSVPNIAGLQTRASVQNLISQQISMGGPNAQAQIQQNLAMAHAEINKLKDKINQFGGGSGDIDMPDFKPNGQKTKSFLKRLEFGSNIQSQKSTRFFPTTTDFGLSAGYKLNDKSVIGIGASYKLGWGRGFNDIHFTSQGLGLRSFVEYKIKNSFYLSGGYEQNYKTAFHSVDELKDYSAWQVSGLIGLSKKYKISKKFKGNMQLLWDFMSYRQIPVTQPFVYRLGYLLK